MNLKIPSALIREYCLADLESVIGCVTHGTVLTKSQGLPILDTPKVMEVKKCIISEMYILHQFQGEVCIPYMWNKPI